MFHALLEVQSLQAQHRVVRRYLVKFNSMINATNLALDEAVVVLGFDALEAKLVGAREDARLPLFVVIELVADGAEVDGLLEDNFPVRKAELSPKLNELRHLEVVEVQDRRSLLHHVLLHVLLQKA